MNRTSSIITVGLCPCWDTVLRFDGIEWGGPRVLHQTRGRLVALGWRWHELRTLWDVDRPEDVERFAELGLG